jgi:hypothetical protein
MADLIGSDGRALGEGRLLLCIRLQTAQGSGFSARRTGLNSSNACAHVFLADSIDARRRASMRTRWVNTSPSLG